MITRKTNNIRSKALALLLISSSGCALSDDLGVYGNLYPIAEKNMITLLKEKAAKFLEDGGQERLMKEAESSVIKLINDPTPVPGITTAVERKTYYFNPEQTFPDGIFLPDGTEVIAKGTVINYFDYQDFDQKIALIDAREDWQVEWAKKIISETNDDYVEVILTAGSTYNTSSKLNKYVYLDQGGQVTRHFGIRSVPALIAQDREKRKMRIDEIPQSE